ncbi:hypothetical protein [Kribbella sp. DT2]|uniref:hypothetical protein n=1 Tax=Kribbella sp. DT2 TaxID=3393427 RepID=UPI003CFAB688
MTKGARAADPSANCDGWPTGLGNTPKYRGPALLPSILAAGDAGFGDNKVRPELGPRPFVIGYIDAACLSRQGPKAVAQVRARIAKFATMMQLDLGHVYVDYPNLGGSSFRVLLIAAIRYNPQQILVPDLAHLETQADARSGDQTRRQLIQRRTKATVRSLPGGRS